MVGALGGVAIAHFCGFSLWTGFGYGLLVGFSPLALLFLAALVLRMNNDRPPCKCGRCKSDQYEFIRMEQNRDGDDEYFYRCPSCGRDWKARGDVFYEIKADGSEAAYMKSNWRQTWKSVESASTDSDRC